MPKTTKRSLSYPLFHPKRSDQVPLVLNAKEFREAFPYEGQYVEFKEGAGSRPIQRTVTAFSNTDGGVLLLGVADDGSVVGKPLTPGLVDDITQAIRVIHNPGRYWLHEVLVEDRPVTAVAVSAREQGFAQTPEGLVLVRRGADSAPLVGAELLQFISGRGLGRFDEADSGLRVTEADTSLLDELREAFGWKTATPDHLTNEKLAADFDGHVNLTVAGALTLIARPQRRLGKAFLEVLRFPDQGVDYDRRVEFIGPVQRQLQHATEFLMAELGTDLVISGVRRVELPKLPEVVVREVIANALAHRSYEENGRCVRVEIRPDRVVVESPGGLPEPVTEENIRETQSARNIRVIRVLRRLGLAEDSGRGIDVIQDSMAEALLDPPRFRDLKHSVRVELPIRGAISPQERAWVHEVERRGGILPTDRLLLVHAARGENLTNERVRQILSVDSRDARRSLRRLTDAGLLQQYGERGGARYGLAPQLTAPAAFRLTPDALEALVVALAREAPVTNGSVRAATGLDRAETLRLLDKLVSDGRLQRSGQRRGTRYSAP